MRVWRVLFVFAVVACGPGSPADAGLDAPPPIDVGPPDAGFSGPRLLSETGLYADIASRAIAPGVESFEVRYPLWADGASKTRYLSVPGTIDTSDMDRWVFPVGTRAWKEFRVGDVLVETRLLEKLESGEWLRVAYVWNEEGTDAIAVPDGESDAGGTAHDVPSSADCFSCHRGARDTLIGVSAIQLTSGSLTALMPRLSVPPAAEPLVPGEGDTRAALGYLHGNCGHCHNDDYPLARFRTMRLNMPYGIAVPEDAPVYRTAMGAMANHDIGDTTTIIVPSEPDRSQLYVRMGLRDMNQMPPLGTEIADESARAAIRSWIAGLPP
jgi:hypothetical protein